MAGVLSKGKTQTWLDSLQKTATWLEGWKRHGAPLLQIEAERLGVVEPGEEKALAGTLLQTFCA